MKVPDKAQRRDTQALFEKLFTSSPDAILVVDREGRILEANPQVESLFGYPCSELLGSPVEVLIPDRFQSVHGTHRSAYSDQPRPVGRPSLKPLVEHKGFLYHAASWKTARRVVAKVEHHQGELFPRLGFIVTNLTLASRAVVRFYNRRGTAEQWIKEGKQAVKMTRLRCHRFRSNEVRLWLSVIAYNLGNLWRRLALPSRIDNWSLTSLQQRLVKTGGRLVNHARYYWLLLAESHLTRRLFGSMVRRIYALPMPSC